MSRGNPGDKGRRIAGGTSDNRFVMFVRDGSVDSSGEMGDVLSVSTVNGHSDTVLTVDEFASIKKTIIEKSREGNVLMPNVTIGQTEQGPTWTMANMIAKIPVLVAGRQETYCFYFMTGMTLVDQHMYSYVCQLHNATAETKAIVRTELKEWLGVLVKANENKRPPALKKRPAETFDLMSVGMLPKSSQQYLPNSVYESMLSGAWLTKRTLGDEKASGIDVQFKYPSCMSCKVGNQPHIAFSIQEIFNQKIQLGGSVGVFAYDKTFMQSIRETTPEEAEDIKFFNTIKEIFVEKGELIGCGITRIEGQNALWLTLALNGERLGVKIKTISRMFLIPTTGGKCLMSSFAVGVVNGEEYPTKDFEKFLYVGLRMINSITFMDKSQIRPVDKFDATMSGTGWFFSPEHVVTCWHVVEGCSNFEFVWPDGQRGNLTLVGKDEFSDLAILKVVAAGAVCLNPLQFAADKPEVSQKVFTVGYPLADYMGKAPKYTEGVISALSGAGDDESMLQTTTPIQCGNSGGPLLNDRCEVVGVMQSKLETQGELKDEVGTVQNVNYAVKVYLVKRLAKKLGITMASDTSGAEVSNLYERVCAATVFIFAK